MFVSFLLYYKTIKRQTMCLSHQPSPNCACRNLSGGAAQAMFVDPVQSQFSTALGSEIGTRYRYIDDTPLVPLTEAGKTNGNTSTSSKPKPEAARIRKAFQAS